MRALKRPARRAVVELAVRPKQCVVARRALRRREARRDVVWHRSAERLCAHPCRLVAAVAIRVRRREGVVVSRVAIGASHDFPGRLQLVRACQRPAGGAVIKDRRGPRYGVVAGGAVRCCERHSRRWVRRVIRSLPGRQVALRIPAVCRRDRQTVVVVDMAGGAAWHLAAVGYQRVRIRQREAKRGVVKLAVGPLRDRVAGRAG